MAEIAELRHEIAVLRVEIEELRRVVPGPAPRADPSVGVPCGVDTSTRYQGVYARHRLSCPKTLDRSRRCHCTPSYYGKVWDPAIHRHRRTERRSSIREAKALRLQLLDD